MSGKQWIASDILPLTAGWHATLHSWDSSEGFFPGGHFWNGTEWEGDAPNQITHYLPEPKPDRESAIEWAYENDPEW